MGARAGCRKKTPPPSSAWKTSRSSTPTRKSSTTPCPTARRTRSTPNSSSASRTTSSSAPTTSAPTQVKSCSSLVSASRPAPQRRCLTTRSVSTPPSPRSLPPWKSHGHQESLLSVQAAEVKGSDVGEKFFFFLRVITLVAPVSRNNLVPPPPLPHGLCRARFRLSYIATPCVAHPFCLKGTPTLTIASSNHTFFSNV